MFCKSVFRNRIVHNRINVSSIVCNAIIDVIDRHSIHFICCCNKMGEPNFIAIYPFPVSSCNFLFSDK